MGIGNFKDVVGNDDLICGSLTVFAMFINSTPFLSKKILHKFPDFIFCKTINLKMILTKNEIR